MSKLLRQGMLNDIFDVDFEFGLGEDFDIIAVANYADEDLVELYKKAMAIGSHCMLQRGMC